MVWMHRHLSNPEQARRNPKEMRKSPGHGIANRFFQTNTIMVAAVSAWLAAGFSTEVAAQSTGSRKLDVMQAMCRLERESV